LQYSNRPSQWAIAIAKTGQISLARSYGHAL
jgi:hypothetical protein